MTNYQICTKCIMDTSDKNITFDENGLCNYCRLYESEALPVLLSPKKAKIEFDKIVQKMKKAGKGKKYDVILGISGGADSSYLAYIAKNSGLQTLLVHVNNGWDADFATKNIAKIVDKTGFDYHEHVLDWEEFKDLQLAYLWASVVDIEVPTDHAILAVVWDVADQHDIKYVLSGTNYATEIYMPFEWNYPKMVLANLLAIHEKFGKVELKTYPTLGLNKVVHYMKAKKMREIPLLDVCNYNVKKAKRKLKDEFDWEDYPGKHYESIFTKFYQAYILPMKFRIDKRRAHFSNLILSDQMTREEALKEMKKPLYTIEGFNRDYKYVIEKLGLTYDEFEVIMVAAPVSHYTYPGDYMNAETKSLLGID